MQSILEFDKALFFFINQGLANPVMDVVCPILREKLTWIPLYMGIALAVYKKYGKLLFPIAVVAVLTILLTDQISSSLIKPSFQRLRPCNDPALQQQVRLLLSHCGAGFSFVSSHAANHFGLAAFFSFSVGRRPLWIALLFFWAFAIAFSQVYVGVHYPLDVAAGALLGVCIGMGLGWPLRKWLQPRASTT